MSDSRWEQTKDIFQAVLERQPHERESYLCEACAGDDHLRAEVLELLASFDEADDFMNQPPIGEVAETIVGKAERVAAGQQIGRYRVERKIGAGGMGEVFLALDSELERLVALKILSAAFSNNDDRIRRFMQEARAASALNHPNILTIYEIGQIDGLRFIATEYIEGETLRERQRRAPLSLNEILDVFAQTAAALNASHRAGIVHRDIKPENIMLRADGLVKVLDFGLAKLIERSTEAESRRSGEEPAPALSPLLHFSTSPLLTEPGMVMGTVAYMSPEQARGFATDARTDVWSLGVCLYETLFGAQPFAGETASDQIAAILKSEPEIAGENVPTGLRRIVAKCLQKKVAERYQTIKDFASDLKSLSKESDFSVDFKFPFAVSGERQLNGKQTDGQTPFPGTNSLPPRASSAEYVVGAIKKHKFLSLAASGAAVIVLALILSFSVFTGFSSTKPINSLAVLSFDNAGGDADGEYLSDGLSESLINKLSALPQLKVAARSSAFKYKGKEIDPNEVARALRVEAVLTGRINRRGDDLQISVELINGEDNSVIWGERYRRKVADAQAIQDEIAQSIVQKLRLKISGAQAERIRTPLTENSEAYQLYLNGVFYRRQNGPGNVRKAIEYQNRAITLDPNFALAYAELGYNYYNLVGAGVVDAKTGLPPARRAIEKALSLNDSLAEAHDINSRLKAAEFDWTGAETEIRRAIELNPNLASAHTYYSTMLSEFGRFDEALNEIRKARTLDPLRINLVNYEAEILFKARRYDHALATYESGNPEATGETFALINHARVAAAKERYLEAIALLRKSLEKNDTTMGLTHLGRIYALTGEREQALAVLERLGEIERTKEHDKHVSPEQTAILYSALGMREQAFASLEQAFAERELGLPAINVEPEYDALRDDPRFQDLLRRLNFPQ